MNFRKLSKEKRNQLIAVVLGTLVVLAGLYFGLINYQEQNLRRLAEKKIAIEKRHRPVLDAIKNAGQIEIDLTNAKAALAEGETDIASGDLYAWVINWLRQFKASHKVEIPQFSQLSVPLDVNLLPNFPYKQTTLTVAGTAHYHDLGRFLADLENQFPHVRLLNLSVDANAPSTSVEPETLSFKLDIALLAKPTS